MRSLLALLCLLILAAPPAGAQQAPRAYRVDGDCGGMPRTTVGMAEGFCLGRVWQRAGSDGPRMPRTLYELPNGDWLVADLGSWDAGRGAIWRLSRTTGGEVRWTRLLAGLSMPHTIARGPDGRIYVAEMSRIFAFDPANPAEGQTVIEGLPDNRLHENRHPLSAFAFQADGSMLVNVGAPSDRCLNGARPNVTSQGRCAEEAEQAMVRRYAYQGNGRWSRDWTVFASGLRNSVAMAVHPSGSVWQGENSVDLDDPLRPYDEINHLQEGRHYGWPYCTDMATALPGWTARQSRCGERSAPHSLLPPHSAPLALVFYDGAMFPQLRGQMLIGWHGYRRGGGRIMAVETGADGAPLIDRPGRYAIYPRGSLPYPASAPAPRGRILTPGWGAVSGGHPMGAPVGITVARDGSIWVADDRNAAILRIARP